MHEKKYTLQLIFKLNLHQLKQTPKIYKNRQIKSFVSWSLENFHYRLHENVF